jgi:hypothetical protein
VERPTNRGVKGTYEAQWPVPLILRKREVHCIHRGPGPYVGVGLRQTKKRQHGLNIRAARGRNTFLYLRQCLIPPPEVQEHANMSLLGSQFVPGLNLAAIVRLLLKGHPCTLKVARSQTRPGFCVGEREPIAWA